MVRGSRRPSKIDQTLLPAEFAGGLPAIAESERGPESTETLQAVARAVAILVEVLQSHLILDRPEIACRACRLISLIGEHHLECAKRTNKQAKMHKRSMEAKLSMDLSKKMKGSAEAPISFEPLRPSVASLIAVLRAHGDNAPLVSAAMQALWDLRCVALETALSSGAGAAGGIASETLIIWRKLLHEHDTKGDIPRASRFLHDALIATEVANARCKTYGIKSESFVGDGTILTPRAQADAEVARVQAAELAADVVTVDWREGEPDRRERRAALREQDKLDRLAAAEAEKASLSARSPFDADSVLGSDAGDSSRVGSPAGVKDGDTGKDSKLVAGLEEGPLGGEWSRAMGYDAYDKDDLDTTWRRPMEATLSRSFSTPAVPPRHRKKHGRVVVPTAASTTDSLDRLLQLEFLESQPGKIRVRLTVQPHDICQQVTYNDRLKQLMDDKECAKVVTSSMAKELKREGFLMPRYGLQVRIRKAKKEQDQRRASKAESALSALSDD